MKEQRNQGSGNLDKRGGQEPDNHPDLTTEINGTNVQLDDHHCKFIAEWPLDQKKKKTAPKGPKILCLMEPKLKALES